jgi:toxin HigB-1
VNSAVDIKQSYKPLNDPIPRKPDGGLDWTKITAIRILGVEDYHG